MRARLDSIGATGWLDYSPASSQTRAPTKMADLLVATTTLENKKGEKVNASEALKGKVVALYVRLALSRTAPPAVAVAPAPAESASPCARQLTCSRSAAGSSLRTGAHPAAVRAARSNHAATAQHQRSTRLDEALCARLSLAASAVPPPCTTHLYRRRVTPRRLHPAAGRRVRDGQRRREALRGSLRFQ